MAKRYTKNGDIVLDLECPAESRVLPMIRKMIVSMAEEMGFSEEDASKIELSVDEACSNVIRHAYESGSDRSRREGGLRVAARRHKDCLKIVISDQGIGFDVNDNRGVRNMKEYRRRNSTGGLGGYIIREFMDEVNYQFSEPRGTRVTMVKNL